MVILHIIKLNCVHNEKSILLQKIKVGIDHSGNTMITLYEIF